MGKIQTTPENEISIFTDELLAKTSLDMGVDQRWCTHSFKTVVGSGVDQCLELAEKKERFILWESNYQYHGANWHIYGLKSPVDSVIKKHRVEIDGCILKTADWSYSAAICENQLIPRAVVPAGNNTWIYSYNQINEIYEFGDDPLTVNEGEVKITRLYKTDNEITEFEIAFTSEENQYGIDITFVDDRMLNYTTNFESLHFPKEFATCEVGIKNAYGGVRLGNFYLDE